MDSRVIEKLQKKIIKGRKGIDKSHLPDKIRTLLGLYKVSPLGLVGLDFSAGAYV